MVDRDCEFSFFQGVHVRFDIRIDISISIRPMAPNLARIQDIEFDSNETNQVGAGDVITSRSRGKLKASPLPECLWPSNLA